MVPELRVHPWLNLKNPCFQVGILMLASLAWRTLAGPGLYLELDGSIYERATADYLHHLTSGAWLSAPLTNQSYTAIEYWPPFYPFLCGLLAAILHTSPEVSCRLTSGMASWACALPVYVIGARLFGHRAGMWAAAAVAFSAPLAWYGSVPRSESLSMLLEWSGIAFLLGARRREWAAAGGLFSLAYMTRFEGLAFGVASLLATWVVRGGSWSRARWAGFGFALMSAPYWIFLAGLNHGSFTLVTPEKRLSDQLEATWTTLQMGTLTEFTARFGPPGLVRLDPRKVATIPQMDAFWWISHALRQLPRSLPMAFHNFSWPLALLAVWSLYQGRRDRRRLGLLLTLLPVPLIALGSFWDPAARYYAFAVPLAALLAGPVLAEGSAMSAWMLRFLLPLLTVGDLYLPQAAHFDIPFALDRSIAVPEGTRSITWVMAESAIFVGGLLVWARLSPALCGLGAGIAALTTLQLFPIHSAQAFGLLVVLALLLAMSCALTGRAPLLACALLWLGTQSLSVISMRSMDAAQARVVTSPAVARWLLAHPESRLVMSKYGYDALRTGHDWMAMGPLPPVISKRDGIDVVVVLWPMNFCPLQTQLEAGAFPIVASFPIEGDRAWRIYKVR
jgi:hypothetical protein